ncbi:hypothetical protein DW962_15415 [Blautia sp. AM46-5]|nr:hypothetical protein DW962_15415 [Blautia sp. AM46-5]
MKKDVNNTISNFIWRFAERCGAQLVTFIVSIVLARILVPEDYGTIALVTVFTAILFLYCRIQLPQQSCFLLHKTSVEYTRLYSSITEVMLYTVEPHIPCNDVFSKC